MAALAVLLVLAVPPGVGLWVSLAALTATLPAAAAAPQRCLGGAMQVVAHPDDDLLFLSPDLMHDIEAGRCVRTVFVTAGDAGRGSMYAAAREDGARAAYADMAAVDNTWQVAGAGTPGRQLDVYTLVDAPTVSLVFLGLPDGGRTGRGTPMNDHQSLKKLWLGQIEHLTAIDGSFAYDAQALVGQLAVLVDAFGPTTVRTQDWTLPFGRGDNADHTATALFMREASAQATAAHTLLAYAGYPSWTRAPNVAARDLRTKAAVLRAYARHDTEMCLRPWCTVAMAASFRVARQYVVASESAADLTKGPGVVVTASSQASRAGQTADKAVDGLAGGTSRPRSTQWRSAGELGGAWWQVAFAEPELVGGVVLADQLDTRDQIVGARLLFSDGSSVAVGPLPTNGSSVTVAFPVRSTDWVRLVVDDVSPTTTAAGLAEVAVFTQVVEPGTGRPGADPD